VKSFTDFAAREVRLTSEREDHILDHAEMVGLLERVGPTLASPERVALSASDPAVELLYSLPTWNENRRQMALRGGKLRCK
jgi:hypothetical protein